VTTERSPAGRAAAHAIDDLWDRARPVLLERVGQLEDAVLAVLEGRLDPQTHREAGRAAHKIAGSAGTFGYQRATDIARELETIFGGEPAELQAHGPHAADRIEVLRDELEGPAPAAPAPALSSGRVLVAITDPPRAQRLLGAAAAQDLEGVVAADRAEVMAAIRADPVDAVLLDLELARGEIAPLISDLLHVNPQVIPLVVSREGVFLDRVESVRAGARGFLAESLPDGDLIRAVVDALARGQHFTDRLLAVDDDPVILGLMRKLFVSAGLSVTTLDDPVRFWDVLEATAPDLVLLDLDMPAVTGLELCRMIRADPRWEATPIVVVTGNPVAQAVQELFAAGADDYVTKPVVGAELLTRVTNRLERVRLYRQLADTDPLTGLPNRRRFLADGDRLRHEALRYRQPMSVAVLDIDQLRRLNDRYSPELGDAVLRRLARLLLEQASEHDLVARWAGAELVIALYGMRREDGVARVASTLEALRSESFALADQPPLRVSCSAGVAEYGLDGSDLHALYRAAAQALQRAKSIGGDRVLPVGWQESSGDAVDVVVVEDDSSIGDLLVHALTTRGLRCLQVTDGPSALTMLTAAGAPQPGVILLDVDLPGLNGLDVLGELSRAGVLDHSKVIMLTARAGEPEVLASFQHGAFDHVAKPFSVPVLVQRVRRALAT
jgi:diguanylate cyclase (GGDEF)-like protein